MGDLKYAPGLSPNLNIYTDRGSAAIGPDGFKYKDSRYVVFKNGSAFDPERQSHIALQQVSNDGVNTIGNYTQLVHSSKVVQNDTEGHALVENPSRPGSFMLFYVVGFYKDSTYRIEYATAMSITGPYKKQGNLLHTGMYDDKETFAPGGPEYVNGNASEMYFMADKNQKYGVRDIWSTVLKYDGDNVTIAQI